ncbi:Protein Rf1, mitochondrial [Cytospora mali]|uniref:Protein Rf1, mitochondrial n=1 Tax=Cytospora mali TaxID=578113 RepID=A0A194UTP8_CYTMA|nr:Protein Rf1, mitochondrial [Valsa mali var. pyri (nom. inval.)]
MLERTAASLEPCNFQRVLPPTATSLKSRRRLHTAFWHHGAADIELSNVWQTLVREPLESLNLLATSQSSRTEALTASTFLLDFLYPSGASSLLRKLSPSVLDRYERPRLYLRGTLSRRFTSSAQQSSPLDGETQSTSAVADAPVGGRATIPEDNFDESFEDEFDDDAIPDMVVHPVSADQFASASTSRPYQSPLETLRELLQADDESEFNHVWQLYHIKAKNREDRVALRTQFLDYATKYRSMSQLLALAIKFKKWETFGDIWERFPEAHRDDVKALNWDHLESILSVDELGSGLKALVFRKRQSSRTIVREDPEFSKSLLNRMIYPCIRRYLLRLDPKTFMPMLKVLKDPLLYEDFLAHVRVFKRDVMVELYTQYRKLPQVKIRGHIMRNMMEHVFYPVDDAAGMEMVRRDWFHRFDKFDIHSYKVCLNFFARRGDVVSVQRLWDDFTTHYPNRKSSVDAQRPDFLPLLHVHAVRGELGEVRRIFSTLQSTYGAKLNVICWNVLLNAHAKAGEYDAAVRVFSVLKEACRPDEYSYGTIMGMAGSRGDLEFTLELYRMAKDDGILPNVAMVDAVVEAYCQNDKYADAENICALTTKANRYSREEHTILWNTLLYHHANRRDLTTVNRLLVEMTERNIPYNSDTYDHLLRGLALCRQPHHALYLLNTAVRDHSFKPTLRHYSLLMSAYLRSGQPPEALRTSTMLRNLGLPRSADVLFRVFQALGAMRSTQEDGDTSKQRTYLLSALRQFRNSIEAGKMPTPVTQYGSAWIQPSRTPDTVGTRTDQASLLIFLFTKMRLITTVQDILALWRSSSPETSNMQDPPLRLLDALMLSAFYDDNYDEVKNIWQITFDRALQMSRVSAPGTTRTEPLPSTRYILNNGLKTMQRMYAAQGDADGLREVMSSVLQAGFRPDSKNWNYYIQFLVSMKKFREAFVVCEEQLMPYWMGWMRVRSKVQGVKTQLPLDARRQGSEAKHMRPISYTLITLSKAYMDLEQMAAWSPEADRLLNYIVERCPGVMSAVKTLLRTGTDLERKIFMGEKRAKLEEEMEREKRDKRERGESLDEDLPQSFQDMLMMAEGGQGTSVKQESWDDAKEIEEGAVDSGSDAGEDGEWYDVNEQDDDNWTPRKPGQEDRSFQGERSAEEAASGGHLSDTSHDRQSEVGQGALEAGYRAAEDAVFRSRAPRNLTTSTGVKPSQKSTTLKSKSTSKSNNERKERHHDDDDAFRDLKEKAVGAYGKGTGKVPPGGGASF